MYHIVKSNVLINLLVFVFACSPPIELPEKRLELGQRSSVPISNDAVDLFIMSGESNIGIAEADKELPPAPYNAEMDNVYIWSLNDKKFVNLWAGYTSHPNNPNRPLYGTEVSMMHEIQKDYNGIVFLLKFGKGGSTVGKNVGIDSQGVPIQDWNTASPGELTDKLILRIKEVQNYFAAAGKTINYRGLIFWTGVNDSQVESYAKSLRDNLKQMIELIRLETGVPHLPFYVSQLNKEVSTNFSVNIRRQINNFVMQDSYSAIFSTDNYPITEGAHFSGINYLNIGKDVLAPLFKNNAIPVSRYRAANFVTINIDYPSGITFHPTNNSYFIGNSGKLNNSSVQEYNLNTNEWIRRIGSYNKGLTGLGLDPVQNKLYMVKDIENIVKVANISNGNTTANLPVNSISNLLVDPSNNRLYVSASGSKVSIYDLSKLSFIQYLPQVFNFSNDMKIFGGHLYVCSKNEGKIYKINLSTMATVRVFSSVANPDFVAYNGKIMIVVSGNKIYEVDESSDKVIGVKTGFSNPKEIVLTSSNKLYLCNRDADQVVILEK